MDQLLKKPDVKSYMAMFEQLQTALENDEKAIQELDEDTESEEDQCSYIDGSDQDNSLESESPNPSPDKADKAIVHSYSDHHQIEEEKDEEEDISGRGPDESRNQTLGIVSSQKPVPNIGLEELSGADARSQLVKNLEDMDTNILPQPRKTVGFASENLNIVELQ